MKLRLTACLTAALFLASWVSAAPPSLESSFLAPPAESRPGCYWYWINDNISKEGITRDLESMARIGIGRAYLGHIFNVREGPAATPVGEVKFMSDPWWEAVQWAVKEAGRCGIEIGFFNSPGWSQSGGPWVNTSQSMRYLASSETLVEGGGVVDLLLPVPEIVTSPIAGNEATGEPFTAGDFQDVRVIAFRQPNGGHGDLDMKQATVTCGTLDDIANLFDGSAQSAVKLQGHHVIEFQFETEQELQSLTLDPVKGFFTLACTVEAGTAGGGFELLGKSVERRGYQGPLKAAALRIPFTPAKTRHLRITLESARPAGFSELRPSRHAAISHHTRKQLGESFPSTNPPWDAYRWPDQPAVLPGTAIDPAGVIDLTANVDHQGRLRWNAPAGTWVVMRTGMLPTGVQCHPASPEGQGLEVDKMSRRHVRDHFDAMIGEFIERTPAEDRKALRYVIADSYETGPQNWTDDMVERFGMRYRYSPVPYLPCHDGRIVGSPEISNRFLWDWRRLVADSIAHEYVGGLRGVANEHGLKLWLENYGHFGFPSEFLLYGSQADQVGGEFWESADIFANTECRAASSCANTYGRRDVYAEGFTSNRNFKQSPADFKAITDWVFSAGVNHLILHVNIHQPDERKPGIIQWFGTAFNRHNTWFGESKAFIDYVRRCGVMLKHGTPHIDVAYYIGQDAPVMTGPLDPPLPDGHDYNHINADVLVNRATVRDGRIHVEGGPAYAVLVLPRQTHMTPAVAAAIRKLADDGATILGPQPETSPSLAGYPECDARVAELTGPMWNPAALGKEGFVPFGRGRVFSGKSLEEVFAALGLGPEVALVDAGNLSCAVAGNGRIGRHGRGGIVFKHRSSPQEEIYFLANTTDMPAEFTVSFRLTGRKPTFWNAVTGDIREVLAFSQENGRTRIPMHLEPSESVFVVFGKAIDPAASGPASVNHPEYTVIHTLDGPWSVRFDGLGAPAPQTFESLVDWTEHPDPAVRHFSGKATYTTTFTLDEVPQAGPLRIHLGSVQVIAEVGLNGNELGTVWTTPWAVDPGKHLKLGENTLAIRVTNTWNNRLVGDAALPEPRRQTYVSQPYTSAPKGDLLPSGLLGPVRIKRQY